MPDDFFIFKERRFFGITERRWQWLGRKLAIVALIVASGFVALQIWPERPGEMLSSAWERLRFQTVGTQVTSTGTLRRMGFCYGSARFNCVVDGDTIWVAGEKIRLQSIDAPEIDGKCSYEKELAQRAKRRLNEILSSEPFSISPSGKDRYGRTLAAIYNRNGEVGAVMVREGLARAWVGRRMQIGIQ